LQARGLAAGAPALDPLDTRIRPTAVPREGFKISRAARKKWLSLPRPVQRHVEAFLSGAYPQRACRRSRAVSILPAPTTSTPGDIEDVAAHLSRAFPRLIRRVTHVATGGHVRVRLECEGAHERTWRGIVCPTGRRVAFKEQHEIVTSGDRILCDWITLDLDSILLQLCVDRSVDAREASLPPILA
jgi:predicted ester cyclase